MAKFKFEPDMFFLIGSETKAKYRPDWAELAADRANELLDAQRARCERTLVADNHTAILFDLEPLEDK